MSRSSGPASQKADLPLTKAVRARSGVSDESISPDAFHASICAAFLRKRRVHEPDVGRIEAAVGAAPEEVAAEAS